MLVFWHCHLIANFILVLQENKIQSSAAVTGSSLARFAMFAVKLFLALFQKGKKEKKSTLILRLIFKLDGKNNQSQIVGIKLDLYGPVIYRAKKGEIPLEGCFRFIDSHMLSRQKYHFTYKRDETSIM